MAQRKTLTEDQLAVLRWIASGCPDGTYEAHFHRISAAALKRRGLVVTSGRGASWSAKVTAQGRDYLKTADGPNPPVPRRPNRSVAQQLIDDVLAAGGEMSVPRRDFRNPDVPDYRHRALLAERQGLVPDGKRLEVEEQRDRLLISLIDDPQRRGGRLELVSIEVPEKVARYHSVVRSLRDRADMQEVSRSLMPRAMRFAQAIVVEAERRGWVVSAGLSLDEARRRNGAVWTPAKQGQIGLRVRDCSFGLRLHEEGVRLRGPWEERIALYRSYRFLPGRERPEGSFDSEAKGVLRLDLIDPNYSYQLSGRQVHWADRQSWTIEERLPHIFREIEERAEEWRRIVEQRQKDEEAAERQRQKETEQRRLEWESHMESARARLTEEGRVAHLTSQLERRSLSSQIVRLCDALAERYGEIPSSREWIAWARGYAEEIDPIGQPPGIPDPPEETPESLQRHLPSGWSANGPNEPPVRLDSGGTRVIREPLLWVEPARRWW